MSNTQSASNILTPSLKQAVGAVFSVLEAITTEDARTEQQFNGEIRELPETGAARYAREHINAVFANEGNLDGVNFRRTPAEEGAYHIAHKQKHGNLLSPLKPVEGYEPKEVKNLVAAIYAEAQKIFSGEKLREVAGSAADEKSIPGKQSVLAEINNLIDEIENGRADTKATVLAAR